MDALDQLLVSCHDYSLNLFVESFLKMVQKLLECDEIELQILATSSVSVGKAEIISSPGRSPGRAIVLPQALASALAKSLTLKIFM